MNACRLCGIFEDAAQLLPGAILRPALVALIRQKTPGWKPEDWICHEDLNRVRALYIEQTLAQERGELSTLEQDVVRSLREQELIAANPDAAFDSQITLGQKLADKIAIFGGSWTFLIVFAVAICIWILTNSIILMHKPFDPFPFILLNLLLSCLAAIQAPVIMMSQNRQEAKDRIRSEHDYRVNLKAELEIRHLHAKMDLLMTHQWQRLLEIQQIQTELIQEIDRK